MNDFVLFPSSQEGKYPLEVGHHRRLALLEVIKESAVNEKNTLQQEVSISTCQLNI